MEGPRAIVFLLLVIGTFVLSRIGYVSIQFSSFRSSDGVNSKKDARPRQHYQQVEFGWWTQWVQSTSSIYQSWNTSPHGWCFPTPTSLEFPPKNAPVRGLLYIKSHKASSSTCSGVNIAMAHHVADRKFSLGTNNNNTVKVVCEHYDRHSFHHEKEFAKRRVLGESLLWTFVRHPLSRDLSHLYHFQVTRRALDPATDTAYLLEMLQIRKGKQTRYLSLDYDDDVNDKDNDEDYEGQLSTWLRQKILEQYDFIGIVERMAESLAVMTILWDLDPTDVIVLSAKQSANGDNYDDGRFQNTCFRLIPAPRNMSDLQPELAHYLQSKDYIEHNPDFLLYYTAHESLDRTIDVIGRAKVEERTKLIVKLQSLAEERCQKEAIYPCSNEGKHQTELSEKNCYMNDAGCGYACVDRLMLDYRRGQVTSRY